MTRGPSLQTESLLNNSPQSYYRGVVERHKRFNKWFVETHADTDGKFSHMPTWLKADLRSAWGAAEDAAATIISELQADRDALKHDIERHLGIIAELDKERDALRKSYNLAITSRLEWRRQAETTNRRLLETHQAYEETRTRALTAESSLSRAQAALLFWMPGVDSRLDEATRERAAQDATLLAGYTGPVDGPCWGNETLDSLSRIKSETVERCAKVAESLAWGHLNTPMMGPEQNCLKVASAIRSLSTDDSGVTGGAG